MNSGCIKPKASVYLVVNERMLGRELVSKSAIKYKHTSSIPSYRKHRMNRQTDIHPPGSQPKVNPGSKYLPHNGSDPLPKLSTRDISAERRICIHLILVSQVPRRMPETSIRLKAIIIFTYSLHLEKSGVRVKVKVRVRVRVRARDAEIVANIFAKF
jgi:hypothetical protein